jgi:hypothetical protein
MVGWLAAASTAMACTTESASSSQPPSSPVTATPETRESATGSQTGTAPLAAVRDDDVTDVEVLATRASEETTGDAHWIPVLARLRVQSWLATRYPGRYDLRAVYSEDWAGGHPDQLEADSLALGVYLDEPLPTLVSVVETGRIGEMVEIEVVLEAGEALIRQEADDRVLGSLPGGVSRGLFILGPTGPGDAWRIHSVTELALADGAGAGGANP